jgi:hydroxyethylthiazole kinase-like sugar kinase family protein
MDTRYDQSTSYTYLRTIQEFIGFFIVFFTFVVTAGRYDHFTEGTETIVLIAGRRCWGCGTASGSNVTADTAAAIVVATIGLIVTVVGVAAVATCNATMD